MNAAKSAERHWPDIPYDKWSESCEALHLWAQIIGQYRLSQTPWLNHSWHATLYVTSRGLTTGPVPDRVGTVSVTLDFFDHTCLVETQRGERTAFPLEVMSVSEFYERFKTGIQKVGGAFSIHGRPSEIEPSVPFAEDTKIRPYDGCAVANFHTALVNIERVFSQFRTGFLGKASPVHLFWGSFDLAVTRFSGRPAPIHPGGIPNLPNTVTREAYSHEVSSAGFWAGSGVGQPMFYSYAYPTPDDFSRQAVVPEAASWNSEMGEFLLPYDVVRRSDKPERTLMSFLQSTYDAAANAGDWDRALLDCELGIPGVPRAVADPER